MDLCRLCIATKVELMDCVRRTYLGRVSTSGGSVLDQWHTSDTIALSVTTSWFQHFLGTPFPRTLAASSLPAGMSVLDADAVRAQMQIVPSQGKDTYLAARQVQQWVQDAIVNDMLEHTFFFGCETRTHN